MSLGVAITRPFVVLLEDSFLDDNRNCISTMQQFMISLLASPRPRLLDLFAGSKHWTRAMSKHGFNALAHESMEIQSFNMIHDVYIMWISGVVLELIDVLHQAI